ncbi:MAG: ankyrin repeat domain-containing protein [Wolbachia sp.]
MQRLLGEGDTELDQELIDAAGDGDLQRVKGLIRRGANVNTKNKDDQTPLHLAALYKYYETELVKYLIDISAKVDDRDKSGSTPFSGAVSNPYSRFYNDDSFELADYFINKGADINTKNIVGYTPLHFASQYGTENAVKYFIDKGANVAVYNKEGNTPLSIAIKNNYTSIVRILNQASLIHAIKVNKIETVQNFIDKEGVNVNAKDKDGRTPLHVAAEHNNTHEISQLLIEKAANVNAKDKDGKTPLDLAIQADVRNFLEQVQLNIKELFNAVKQGELDKVKNLTQRINVDTKDEDGRTLLYWAVNKDRLNIIKYLVEEKKANVNAKDKDGKTSLHWAAEYNDTPEIVQLLIEKGTDINAKDKSGKTPLDLASEEDVKDFLNPLRERYIRLGQELISAAINGSVERVENLVDQGANVNIENEDGLMPLFLAVREGKFNVVKHLIDSKKADVKVSDNYGNTLLHWAAFNGRLKIVEYLIEKGADVNVKERNGFAPLHLAVQGGNNILFTLSAPNKHLKIVEYLIGKDADLEAIDNDERTPLHLAVEGSNFNTTRLLIEKGANVNAKEKNHWVPLYLAVKDGNLNIVELLVNSENIDIEARSEVGDTPLHIAAREGNFDIAKLLINNGTNIDVQNNMLWTPLHEAAGKNNATEGQLNVAKLLISKHTNINAKNDKGYTPLHLAAKKGNLNITEFLIGSEGINIEAKSNILNTPLHIAAEAGKLEIVKVLVNSNANVNAKNEYDETPLSLAYQKDIKDFLKEHGATNLRNRRDTFYMSNSVSRQNSLINSYAAWIKDSVNELLISISNESFKKIQSLFANNSYNIQIKANNQIDRNTSKKQLTYSIGSKNDIGIGNYYLSQAVNITQELEKIVKQAAKDSNISIHRLNIDFIEILEEITKKVISGRFDEISGILNSHVRKACPSREAGCPGKLSPEKFGKFITIFNNELGMALNQSISQMLHSENNILEVKEQQKSLESQKPKSCLDNISAQGQLTQVRGLR